MELESCEGGIAFGYAKPRNTEEAYGMRKSAFVMFACDLELLYKTDRPRLHQRLAIELEKHNALLANVAEAFPPNWSPARQGHSPIAFATKHD